MILFRNKSLIMKHKQDAKNPRRRILGLDQNDLSKLNITSGLNVSAEDKEGSHDRERTTFAKDLSPLSKLAALCQARLAEMSGRSKLVLASLTLVLVYLAAVLAVHLCYALLGWVAASLAGARAAFFSVPEVLSGTAGTERVKTDHNVDELRSIVRGLNSEISLLRGSVEDVKLRIFENEKEVNNYVSKSVVIEDQIEQKKMFEKLSRDITSLNSTFENSKISQIKPIKNETESDMKLSEDVDFVKKAISSLNSTSNKSTDEILQMVLDKFPDLSTIGEKFRNFETRANSLEEKLNSGANISSVMELYLNNITKDLQAEVKTGIEAAVKAKQPKDMKVVDWASPELGTVVTASPAPLPVAGAGAELKVLGVTVWRSAAPPRPGPGTCWLAAQGAASLVLTFPRQVRLRRLVLTQAPTWAAPRHLALWDHLT